MLRRFVLHRDEDESGVSGCGDVASGVVWDDGRVAIRWHPQDPNAIQSASTNTYESMFAVESIHGHGGKTKVVWID